MDGEELYRRYRDKVLAYIRARVDNEQDAEDLCSAVFMKAWTKLPDYDGQRAAVSTWLFTIAHNTVVDFLRSRRPSAELTDTIPAPERDPELEALAEALEAIPLRERDVIVLHYYQGLTLKEIAVHMRLAYSTVKLCHSRALEMLGQMLRPESAASAAGR